MYFELVHSHITNVYSGRSGASLSRHVAVQRVPRDVMRVCVRNTLIIIIKTIIIIIIIIINTKSLRYYYGIDDIYRRLLLY
jgi:hypothetical protein